MRCPRLQEDSTTQRLMYLMLFIVLRAAALVPPFNTIHGHLPRVHLPPSFYMWSLIQNLSESHPQGLYRSPIGVGCDLNQ